MKILITGGTGLIGRELIKLIMTHHLVVLTRNIYQARQKLAHISNSNLNFIRSLDELSTLDDFDAVINLAGEPIADKRWTKQQKKRICDSRWSITQQLVSLIQASSNPPRVFISGSAVGYYGDHQASRFDERVEVHSERFSHYVCANWEKIALNAKSDNTRVILLRTGVVLSMDGGAMKKMLLPYQLGLGGPIGNGKQLLPWIHMVDMARAIVYLLECEYAHGAFNITAPNPVSNKEFSKTLAHTLGRPRLLFTPKWLIKLLMGESSELLLDSLGAKPRRLIDAGFQFHFSRIEPALSNLLHHHH
ncbi:TIGR01777 family oxidoreductase [Vibrio nitrifigilis]|uniref:TIGR01777 family protein n=1 Tax=Vibrio nitrifigilis TaxID=2789781 RepID=A0ABS0GBM5_9VIBR|nr:TIGR01777 family oxidoreductase [Vibrio nitrifigilis]MBF8999809.1 TIGR01777 family protein [Vibrio nitrifigilis]